MKNIIYKVHQNRYFLLFIVLFAYIHSIYTRISVRQQISAYTFTPEAAIASLFAAGVLFLVILFFIRKWQRSDAFSTKKMLKIFGTSLIVYVLIMQVNGLFIAFIFDNIERNFNRQTFVLSLFSDLLDGLIYGSFFIAYYYYNNSKKHQQQLEIYHRALAESKINQLKTQLNPHFLFNNLNILDQLIEEDSSVASAFLNDFSELYRYVLETSDKSLVSLSDEFVFAKSYFRTIQHKYGNAYLLKLPAAELDQYQVPPLTLQLLLENAIDHNLGRESHPVMIEIEITDKIIVRNNIIPKQMSKRTGGRSLLNLQKQYNLLSSESVEIIRDQEYFTVKLPLILKEAL